MRHIGKWPDLAAAAAAFALSLALGTWKNDFPPTYHPDELSKVRQVRTAEYNFHHPLLLLHLSKFLSPSSKDNPREVARAGRLAAALFAAGAAAALSLAAATLAGQPAGVLAGLLTATNPQFVELAHYMKEDTALTFGVAVAVAALSLCWHSGRLRHFVFLGAACGMAASGKYVGLITLLLPAAAALRARQPGKSLAVSLAAAVAVILFLNWPALVALPQFLSGVFPAKRYLPRRATRAWDAVCPMGFTGRFFWMRPIRGFGCSWCQALPRWDGECGGGNGAGPAWRTRCGSSGSSGSSFCLSPPKPTCVTFCH